MDVEIGTDSANRRLNRLVAITVVILSVFGAVTKIKDDNIVQAMQKAKSESVDAWAEYQARASSCTWTRTDCRRSASWKASAPPIAR